MAHDKGFAETQDLLDGLEEDYKTIFDNAFEEVKKAAQDYFEKLKPREAEMRELLDAGEIDKSYFNQWRINQYGRGERFEQLAEELSVRIGNSAAEARKMLATAYNQAYAINRNYSEWHAERYTGKSNWTLWNESTIQMLIVEKPDLMPYYDEDFPKALTRGLTNEDIAWGKEQITKQTTAAILQGISIDKLAEKIMGAIMSMEYSAAVRAARTAVTNAQNAGRQDTMEEVKAMGVKVKKEWIATLDSRTRESHAEADGQIVDIHLPFIVGGEMLMYPADANGSPAETYNCRCCTRQVFPEYPYETKRITYSEWKEEQNES